jgi:FdhD protein
MIADIAGVAAEIVCDRFSQGGWARTSVHVPVEKDLTLYVNLKELVTILCTPAKVNFLVLGFLYAEGLISKVDDVVMMRVCEDESEIDVRLRNPDFELPTKRTLTSGCGGGATFLKDAQKVESDLVVKPEQVLALMKELLEEQKEIYQISGGLHASALCDAGKVLVMAEDIGRHNTLDKIQGECLMKGLSTKDRLLLSTGRVSSEMLIKAARMGVPVVVSRHSPTGRAVGLAVDVGISLVGYARGGRLSVYSHPERLGYHPQVGGVAMGR